ncbi:MAG: 30S ribosomal protein S31 [Planctomycetota bacterium]|jgi:30S ribosomal protein S31
MGRGDKKTTKGKISKGSYGKYRPKNKNKNVSKEDAAARSSSTSSR